MPETRTITLRINGREEEGRFPAHRTLLEALRHLGHMEVKCGCEKGDCGACAVLLDGMAVDSCLTLAWMAAGKEITTVSGLGDLDSPHPLQKAFADGGAAQCGYCIPGIIIAAKAIIDEHPEPSEDDIRLGLSGNLCRCTGYTKIFEAIADAAKGNARRGRCTMTRTEIDPGTLANVQFRQVGKPLTRTDAPGKVTGRTPYAGDYVMPNMLHMRVVRADIASARLAYLDVSKARALRGVACVLTADDLADRTAATDIPGQTGQKRLDTDQPILVKDRVRYFGEPLALVAAETRDIADHAAELIEVELEPIPGVYDPLEALKPGAPLVYGEDNIVATRKIKKGDAEAGFAEADLIVENTYRTPFQEHAFLEPEVRPRLGGRELMWSTSASRPR